ncbi:MAG: nitrate reductase [Bilophila sp.]
MNVFYNFAVGPLAWLAWGIFIGGMVWRLWSLARLAQAKDASSLAYFDLKCGLISFFHWAMPFGSLGWRSNPLLTVATFVLHLGLLCTALFYSAHNVMWDYNFGFSLPSLPDGVADAITICAILACLVLGWRRLAVPAASQVTRRADWFSLVIVSCLLVSGFAAAHGWGQEPLFSLLHVLFAEGLLVCLPFTRLSHAFLIPFTRAYMGSESIGVRRTCDW